MKGANWYTNNQNTVVFANALVSCCILFFRVKQAISRKDETVKALQEQQQVDTVILFYTFHV